MNRGGPANKGGPVKIRTGSGKSVAKTPASGKSAQAKATQKKSALAPAAADHPVFSLPVFDLPVSGAPVSSGPVDRRAGQPKLARPARSADQLRLTSQPRPGSGRAAQAEDGTHTPSTLRLFYALKVPSNVAGPLAEVQRRLKGNWRSVRADQLHVTLAYLPAVPPARIGDLKALGLRLLGNRAPMDVRLRGTGYFPNEGSPRVWFVKVESDGLDELAAELRAGIQALGIETDDLNFKAHITLARKKGPAPRVPPLTFDLGWQASGAALMRSILRKTGPIYETESSFRFQGARPPAVPAPAPDPSDEIPGQEAHQETP
ncbi:RNA 2',3'-cyclic phosphodiesterase [Deinococcus sp. Leaf326]|uniref:RNA 2',3'-cyclic phosphodiesterase n=1 Tax=Deinococcus sp. Leaf326 TaxID=1736338 RepID=UPI000ABC7AAD